MWMIHKFTTMIIKKMILCGGAQTDHNLELLNTWRRMVMHYRITMDDKGRIITHTGPRSMEVIEIRMMMMMMMVICGSEICTLCADGRWRSRFWNRRTGARYTWEVLIKGDIRRKHSVGCFVLLSFSRDEG